MNFPMARALPALLVLASTAAAPQEYRHAGGSPLSFEQHRENVRGAGTEGPVTWPLTAAESSAYGRSSRLDEVLRFVDELEALPRAARLHRRTIGRSNEGRELVAVAVRSDAPGGGPRSNVIINANIHGGEIEGKVAVQILLREFALGYHSELLESLDITFVPVFNVDGNDAIARRNRVTQNGPDGGVGERPNAQGLDLNRDFVKAESPEVAALLGLANELRPIAFMDLHTTNGSAHGYDLTYAPSLSPNADPGLDAYAREVLLEGVRATLSDTWGIETFDYGNFGYAPRQQGSRGDRGEPVRWSTYDSRPRFGTNLMGLRDTVAILSEAYSYLPYERRIEATYAFVLECLRGIARDRAGIVRLIDAAGARRAPCADEPWRFGVDAEFLDGGTAPVPKRRIDSVVIDLDPDEDGVQEGTRRVAGPREPDAAEVTLQVAFRAAREVDPGAAWVVANPSDKLLRVLEVHLGNRPRRLTREVRASLDVFLVDEASRRSRPFQGHRETSVNGSWERREAICPSGSVIVPSTPLVTHLLHPESDDSLTTWNLFDDRLSFDGTSEHPAWRVPCESLGRFEE